MKILNCYKDKLGLKTIAFFVISIYVITNLQACDKKLQPVESGPYCLPDSLLKSVALDTVKKGKYTQKLQIPGKVTYNDEKVVKIFPFVSGTVLEVKVQLGDRVEKGQILATIRSSEVAGFSNDLTNALANVELTKKALATAKDLFASGLSSQKDLIQAQTDYRKARSDSSRITTILKINGGGNGSVVVVKAPISGFLVDKQITPNTQIRADNGNNLFMISDLRSVWVIANVYESDITKVKRGQPVDVTTLSYPDRLFKGVIDKIYNVLDPVSKVMKVRIQLKNDDYALKPEMFASVVVSQKESSGLIGIPSRAVIFDDSKNYVLVYKDNCHIESRSINITGADSTVSFITSGLSEQETIITRNQLFVYQALNQ